MSIMVRPIITLTTDFGLRDSYVAEMKGVILGICPDARIVDVSHEIEKFNIRMGAFILACAAPSFPKGTIHVAVVDPGVGTKRKPILIQTKQAYFIGPDNGILTLAAEKQGIEHVYEITKTKLIRTEVSSTFHGRDIFAPTAAHLTNGIAPSMYGPEIRDFVEPSFTSIIRNKDRLIGEVLYVDCFGNIITNFGGKELKKIDASDEIAVKLGKVKLKLRITRAYGDAKERQILAIIGSHGFLEISVNQGDASEYFKARATDTIMVSHPRN
jgi:S-adenosylmethionine hydrolase